MFVNISFNKEDSILIKICPIKGNTTEKLLQEYPGKELEWAKSSEADRVA